MNLSVVNIELEQLADYWVKAPKMVMAELSLTLASASAMLENKIVTQLPRGATSHLAQSVTTIGPITTHATAETMTGSSLIYAAPVELGTKPHFPPIAPLEDWVQAVLGIEDEMEINKVATLIAIKISKKGTKGNFAYKNTFEQSQSAIDAQFKELLISIKNKISGQTGGKS